MCLNGISAEDTTVAVEKISKITKSDQRIYSLMHNFFHPGKCVSVRGEQLILSGDMISTVSEYNFIFFGAISKGLKNS